MADRSSAEVFSLIFEMIDKEIKDPESRERLAIKFWKTASNYDFDDSQMECDAALIRLGLAKRGPDPEYPDEIVTIYKGR